MRIVTFAEFLKLPKGTLYCRMKEGCFDPFEVKGVNTGETSWFYQSLGPQNFDIAGEDYFEVIEEARSREVAMDFDDEFRGYPDEECCFGARAEEVSYCIFSETDRQQLLDQLRAATPDR